MISSIMLMCKHLNTGKLIWKVNSISFITSANTDGKENSTGIFHPCKHFSLKLLSYYFMLKAASLQEEYEKIFIFWS